MTVHQLKCWPEYFKPLSEGIKTFDLRKDDRLFAVGDEVMLYEFRPKVGEYTGRCKRFAISFILRDFDGLTPGYCILQLVAISPVATQNVGAEKFMSGA